MPNFFLFNKNRVEQIPLQFYILFIYYILQEYSEYTYWAIINQELIIQMHSKNIVPALCLGVKCSLLYAVKFIMFDIMTLTTVQ